MMRRIVVLLAALTGVVVQAAAPADPWGRVAALYEQRLQQAGIVGSSLLVVKDGSIAHMAFEGCRDRATKRPTDADTVHHWASITKTLSGVAIMQLRDRLNAPVGDMAKWLTFLIDGNDTVLKRSSLEEMSKPQIRARGGEGGSGDDVQAGLSCFIERYGNVELVGHSGDQNGFISHLYVHRPSRSGYVVSFNTDVTSKRDPRHTTRAVDNDLRDTIVRELFVPGARR
ncbi:MAG TPA: serine hydrolase domain-containing protein [Vicinamibacterales bacterium]